MNDSKGIFFEHILASTVLESSIRFIPFIQEPLIIGISGTTVSYIMNLHQTRRKRYYINAIHGCN